MQIALDTMGGDHGTEELISGALLALEELADLRISLVGDKATLQSFVESKDCDPSLNARIDVVHASQVVEMDESPVEAIRKKKDSSIMVAFELASHKKVDAVVSAGNSGATMAAAVRKLKRLKNVSRPGLASAFPTLKNPVIIMDVGANVDCKSIHLYQFAVMAAEFARIYNITNPRVGILSNGEEVGKGNSLVKETYALLEKSSLNFVGNVEGRDVFHGDIDVIVCDGFVGNICLKVSEGLAEAAMLMLRDEITQSTAAKIGYLLARPAFNAFKKRVDYAEYGGALLLGINGIAIICHGKSSSHAIKNAILEATKMVKNNVNERIVERLTEDKAQEIKEK